MILYIDCVSEQQIMQYNQAHNRHNSTKWQGHYRNNKYPKNNEEQAALMKQTEVEDQFSHRIYQLRDLIIEEREKIINSFTNSNKQEVREMLVQSCRELFECEFKIAHQECSIKQMQNINNIKKQSIAHYEKMKQHYIQNKILLTDEKDNLVQLQQLASRIRALDRQINAYDLFTYQSEMLNQLQTLKKKLLSQKKKNMQLREQLEIRQLSEKVQKNNLVILIAKYQSLSRDHQQQQKTLICLQKHREQIQDRLKMLLQEKQEIAKKSSIEFTISKQIAECEQQKRRLMQQYEKEKEIQKIREQNEKKQLALSWKTKYQLEEQLRIITEQYRKIKKKDQRKEKRYQTLKQSNKKLCQKIKILEEKISGISNTFSQSQSSEENQSQNNEQQQECSVKKENEQEDQQQFSSQEQKNQIQQKEYDSQRQNLKVKNETKEEKNRKNKTQQKYEKYEKRKDGQEGKIKVHMIDQLEKEKRRIEEQREQEKENKIIIANVGIIAIIFIVLALIYTSLYS